jgi:threonine synthase
VDAGNLLEGKGARLSSANSINIGRLAPQVVYYFKAYADLVKAGRVSVGEPIDFVVPTGNFGDILAGYFAKHMGLPVGTLVCASNANDVLTDFIRTGVYDRNRPFYRTSSPSMDILVSSNLERLLFLLSGCDDAYVAGLMAQLKETGRYEVTSALLEKLQSEFWAGCCDDAGTKASIADVWNKYGYLCDTHTAVAWNVAEQYAAAGVSSRPVVVLSTASAYKFPAAVLDALGIEPAGDEFRIMEQLQELTGVPMPKNLSGLREKPVLHRDVIEKDEILDYVLRKIAQPKWN